MIVRKLHRRTDDGVLHFYEAFSYPPEGYFCHHWGRAGEPGDAECYELPDDLTEHECIESLLAEPRSEGFAVHGRRVIEVQYDLADGRADLDMRNAVNDLIEDALGANGLGEWIGSSVGAGRMENAYTVVDVDLATELITSIVQGSTFPMFDRINVQHWLEPREA
ncbi:MAG TPA: hypothetical protein VGJ28_04260 [Micromonosporaceae bacterium]